MLISILSAVVFITAQCFYSIILLVFISLYMSSIAIIIYTMSFIINQPLEWESGLKKSASVLKMIKMFASGFDIMIPFCLYGSC